MRCAVIVLIMFVFPVMASPATIYVPDDYPAIQGAINAALGGDTIIVRSGTYVENLDFSGKAITVKSEYGPKATVIDGNQQDIVVMFINREGENSRLEGFTISNGNAYCGNGSGVFCFQSSPVLCHNIFSGNTAESMGGGMYSHQSNPTLIDCAFMGNTADTGGGMFNNLSSPRLIRCTFTGNTAHGVYGGGGMYNTSGNPTLTGCAFTGNSAVSGGGVYNTSSSPVLIDCTFTKNSASEFNGGGGIYNFSGTPILANCIFLNNIATFTAGAVYNHSCNPFFVNCTFVGNTAKSWSGAMVNVESFPSVTNCILWDNTPEGIRTYKCTATVTHTCIQGGYAGQGNIKSDPKFVDPVNNDYHLTFTSPCKDAGDNSAYGLPGEDFEADLRIAYGTVDMGADEFYTHLYHTGDAVPGGQVRIKLVDLPGSAPLALFAGSGVLPDPISTTWGDWWNQWWLQFPVKGPVNLGSIPSPDGVYILSAVLPSSVPGPYSIPMQAVIRKSLTNLCVLQVE